MGILISLFVCYIIYLILRTPSENGNDATRFVADNCDTDYLSLNFPDDDNWITDPAYSYLPGNIYYHDSSFLSGCSYSGSDWMTDPCCSCMPGNIFHDDHNSNHCGSSTFNDDWHSTSSACSSFSDSGSSSGSSFNDD